MFPDIACSEWLAGRPESALYDFASPGFSDPTTETGAVPDALADRSGPPAGVNVYTQVATAYGVHPEQVVLTAGVRHATVLAIGAAVTDAATADVSEPTVLVEEPTVEPHVRTPVGLGADVERFSRASDAAIDASGNYPLVPERVRSALTDETCLVTTTDRHATSGEVADRDRLAETAAAVAEQDAHLLVDESQAPYPEDGVDGDGAFGARTAAGASGAVVAGSLERFPGAAAVGVGWLVADPEFAATARRVRRHVPAVSRPSVALAERALADPESFVTDATTTLRENAARLSATLADSPALAGHVDPGAGYALVDHATAEGDELAEAAWREGVLVLPGRFVGEPGAVRFSLGTDPETFAAGLQVFVAVARNLSV